MPDSRPLDWCSEAQSLATAAEEKDPEVPGFPYRFAVLTDEFHEAARQSLPTVNGACFTQANAVMS